MMISLRILELLTPGVGVIMAKSILDVQCKKIGKTPDSLSASDLSALGACVQTGVKIFLGTDKARELGLKISALS